jgi:hypothetical protein
VLKTGYPDTLPSIVVAGTKTGDWQYVRKADNWQNNGFVGNVNSPQIRCFQSASAPAQGTMDVKAGATIGYSVSPNAYHPGPAQIYLAKAPEGTPLSSWDGSGAVWFKIFEEQPIFGGQLTWPSMS